LVDTGDSKATDALIMSVAAERGAGVLTNDLDFGSILAATGTTGPSVIQIRAADLRPTALGDLLLLAIERVPEELASGALVTLEPDRTRLRVLPLSW
jgi:predicted nuclease of predicted toxin-antitoxin system